MRRVFFLVPEHDLCKNMIQTLIGNGIDRHHIHVVARDQKECDDLPKANILQTTEVAHGVEWGLGIGGVAGALGGLLAVTFPPAGLVLGTTTLAVTTAVGAGFGAVVTGLISLDEPSHDLEPYSAALLQGNMVILVDLPRKKAHELVEQMQPWFPDVRIDIGHPPKGKSLRPYNKAA